MCKSATLTPAPGNRRACIGPNVTFRPVCLAMRVGDGVAVAIDIQKVGHRESHKNKQNNETHKNLCP